MRYRYGFKIFTASENMETQNEGNGAKDETASNIGRYMSGNLLV